MDIQEAQVVKPEFKPNVNYTWNQAEVLKISGGQLHVLHNTMHAIFEGELPQSKMYLLLNDCLRITTDIIKLGVSESLITEAKTEEKKD